MPGCCCCSTPRPRFGTIRFWFLPAVGTSGSECTKCITLSIKVHNFDSRSINVLLKLKNPTNKSPGSGGGC